MIPSIKAIGTNTAQMAKVVAKTARPISSVPSSAACMCDLPIAKVPMEGQWWLADTVIGKAYFLPHTRSLVAHRKLGHRVYRLADPNR